MCSFAIREQIFSVSGSNVLTKASGTKDSEKGRSWRKLHNTAFRVVYSLSHIIGVTNEGDEFNRVCKR
jgi:hypothetical protein